MNLLLDTSVVVWWLLDRARISPAAKEALANAENTLFASAASAFEIAIKQRIGKLPLAEEAVRSLPEDLEQDGIALLDITFRQAILAGRFAAAHRDPFDRLIAALARAEDMPIVTSDRAFADFGVRVIW
jgi:PIN domain nuclease of toxin-antitoxin system